VKARTTAVLLVALTGVLAAYMAVRAFDLIGTGQLKGILLGVGVLLLVAVGVILLYGEVRFGIDTQRLGERLAREGGLPELPPDVARLPSGRLTRDAADEVFAERRAEVEAAPQDWRAWFRLGTAYGDARDTARGRTAMRRAVRLERADRAP
jgi:cytochrome c-type biogenesis protein CcmH/NrfG